MLYPFYNLSMSSYNFRECFYHYSSFSQSIQMFSRFPPKHHGPVPMPTVSGRLFRCTGMEAAEMCHHWQCRRGEELCVWRDAQRKKRVGCRDVYKEELSPPSPQLAQTQHTHTHSVISQQSFRAKSGLEKEQNRISQILSHQAEPSGLNIKQLSLIEYCISYFD